MFFSTWEKLFSNPLDLSFNITSYLLPERPFLGLPQPQVTSQGVMPLTAPTVPFKNTLLVCNYLFNVCLPLGGP